MKSRLLFVSATAIMVAAFAWAGCSSDESDGGAAGAAGAGKGGAAGNVNKGGAAGSVNKGGAAGEAGQAQGGAAGTANGGSAGEAGTANGGSAGSTTVPPLPQGCLTDDTITLGCNPMTNENCDTAGGEACDMGENGFECFPAPNEVPVGGDCNNSAGPYCEAKLHCTGSKCEKWCCADSDCTGDTKCIAFDATMGTIGTCGKDTTGQACTTAEECGNTGTMICDPGGTGCQKGQCDGTTQCATGKVCMGQVSQPSVGACYTECTALPAPTGCGAQEMCAASLGQTKGACYKLGTGADGAACAPVDDLSTGCVAGLVCASEGADSKCRVPCDPWGTPACGANLACDVVTNACIAGAEAVAIGAACTGDDFAPCGVDTGKVKGVCLTSVCEQWCRPGQAGDCPTGKACTGSVGVDEILMYCE